MGIDQRVRKAVLAIANRRNNVTMSEIEWVVGKLDGTFDVSIRKATHGTLFRVGDQKFMVNNHNKGNKQVKAYCVDDFVDAMNSLGVLEEEEVEEEAKAKVKKEAKGEAEEAK